jgi:3alpha(or 20beta)-hydroxysteroid dehydrogenase
MASVQEITNAIIFLSSDASSFVTGSNFVIDGGRTIV